jgi:Tfp pilus assembly protein PilF
MVSRPGHCGIVLRHVFAAMVFAGLCAAVAAQEAKLTPEERAAAQWQAGYVLHVLGDYEGAIEAFRASIATHPSAEAHTFLGWSLSHIGKLDEAIAQCKIAIKLDPEFGNPYNDIGVYLMSMGRSEEAIPWFEKAIAAKRYCCYHYAHGNLGQVLLGQGRIEEAERAFKRALEHDPHYLPALAGLLEIRKRGFKGI